MKGYGPETYLAESGGNHRLGQTDPALDLVQRDERSGISNSAATSRSIGCGRRFVLSRNAARIADTSSMTASSRPYASAYLELDAAELAGEQRRLNPDVVLAFGQHVSDDHDELSCSGDRGDRLAPLRCHALEEGTQRARRARSRPGGFDKHSARLASALLGDPPMIGRCLAGLAGAPIEAEIADQLFRVAKAPDVADGSRNAVHIRHVYAGQRHQLPDDRIRHGGLRDVGFHIFERCFDKLDLCQVAIDSGALVSGQPLGGDPLSAADAG